MNLFNRLVKKCRCGLFLCFILLISFFTKAWRFNQPSGYYFDEIYYGFTAAQYAQGNMDAWVFDTTAPKGFSYTWDHPPVGKLLMSVPIKIFGVSAFSRRLVPLLFGTFLPLAVYFFTTTVFPRKKAVGLLATLLITFDGLVLTMSRIALVDIMLTTFILLSAMYIWKGKTLYAALFFGLAVSTKWTGIYLLPIYFFAQVLKFETKRKGIESRLAKVALKLVSFVCIGSATYILSYAPMINHFGWSKFVDLQKQMYWYHTGLKATHPSQSKPYTWPLNLRPVWLWSDSQGGKTANIYAMGNPVVFWGGVVCVLFISIGVIRTRSKTGMYLLACYLVFWLPWIFSPRLMFLYHYLPSVPFMVVCTSLVLTRCLEFYKDRGKVILGVYLLAVVATFMFFYPYWTGLPVDKDKVDQYVWLKTWKY